MGGFENFSKNLNLPWLVLGDFNEVTTEIEKFGGRCINQRRVNLFINTMNNCKLLDLGYNGERQYTWLNKRKAQPILQRLYRGWANAEWISVVPNSPVWHLPRIILDHCMIHI